MSTRTAATTVPQLSSGDASASELLPEPSPLAMPAQDFDAPANAAPIGPRGHWTQRAALWFGAILMTGVFAAELHAALSLAQMTPLQFVFLILATISFGWIVLGTLSAAMGFLPLFAGDNSDGVDVSSSEGVLDRRVALLFPVYHEEPARIAGTISALAEELHSMGQGRSFDFFVLSDTRGSETGAREEAAYGELKRALAPLVSVYYRRRIENTAKKSGNIHDWVERFGGAYESFVILDGDSIMSADTVVRLALAMEKNSSAGLIQSVPRLVGGHTLLQKLQQFASNIYGPAIAAGISAWHRGRGNYWGHNAVIRTKAFAASAGLPVLPGRAPFGGTIQSHDFVEAALLQRAGWGVYMAPSLTGSFEGAPPCLSSLTTRDRRWAQGNLQHLAIVGRRGLTAMGRLHLAMGAWSYLISVVWAASLVVGIILALQSRQIIPSYFVDSKTLFPIWPVMDPGAAMRLFLTTMTVVLLPKGLGLLLELKRSANARELFGMPRALAGVATETVFSILIAPILMMTQMAAVFEIVSGRDSGWKAQRREGVSITMGEAMQHHIRHGIAGAVFGLTCWWVSPGLLFWMSPVIAGLLLAGPIHWLTGRPAVPALAAVLDTPEDRDPAPVLVRTARQTEYWNERFAVLHSDRTEPQLKAA